MDNQFILISTQAEAGLCFKAFMQERGGDTDGLGNLFTGKLNGNIVLNIGHGL